jgi:hypothetical protein
MLMSLILRGRRMDARVVVQDAQHSFFVWFILTLFYHRFGIRLIGDNNRESFRSNIFESSSFIFVSEDKDGFFLIVVSFASSCVFASESLGLFFTFSYLFL